MQCHIEMTEPMVRQWADFYKQELVEDVPTIQTAQTMQNRIAERIEQLNSIADTVYARWLRPIRNH
jgi:hypothetical protein